MAEMKSSPQSPDIAIIGAGIAGFAFAIACQNAHLNYTIYESGLSVWQHGSGIGLGPNAVQGLTLIDGSLPAALQKAVGGEEKDGAMNLYYRHGENGSSWSAFDTIWATPVAGATTVSRTALVNALLQYVPQDKIRFGKHLTSISDLPTGQVQVNFRDGSSAVHDVVVGCDGIHSRTRTHILGKDDADGKPRFTGKIVHRAEVDARDVEEILGATNIEGVSLFMGHHGHIVLLPTDGRKKYSVAGNASRKSWDHEKWVIESTAEELKQDFVTFDDRLVRLLGKADNTDIWALFDIPYARTFVKGNVAILGDAAHASTPYQGSGTSMAIEDAYILANLLARAPGAGQSKIRAALRAYDAVRRPRTQKQIHTALEAGWMHHLELPMLGEDIEAIKKFMQKRLEWIWFIDLKAELERAVEIANE